MRSTALIALVVATTMAMAAGCSDGGGTLTGAAGSGGGAAGSTGSGGGCVATGGTTGAAGAGGSAYTRVAVCGQRGQATATATTYTMGWEEFFMTGDEGFGDDICVVRFDVTHSGDAPGGCTECSWTQTVQYSNPTIVTDANGACANSDLGLSAAKIATISGSRMPIGFVREWQGAHGSVRFRYFENRCAWDVYGNATWDEAGTNLFRYDHRDGFCNY
jgi:hypothetical protein